MKRAILFLAAIALATPAIAQHVHEDMQAQAGPPGGASPQGQGGGGPRARGPGPPAGAPPQGQGGGPPGARGQGPQTPPIDVPWNDAIPAGTAEHAARALK